MSIETIILLKAVNNSNNTRKPLTQFEFAFVQTVSNLVTDARPRKTLRVIHELPSPYSQDAHQGWNFPHGKFTPGEPMRPGVWYQREQPCPRCLNGHKFTILVGGMFHTVCRCGWTADEKETEVETEQKHGAFSCRMGKRADDNPNPCQSLSWYAWALGWERAAKAGAQGKAHR